MTSDPGAEASGSPAVPSSPPPATSQKPTARSTQPSTARADPPRAESCRQVRPRPSGLVVSKQWVLPPRPKPGRKPKPKLDGKSPPLRLKPANKSSNPASPAPPPLTDDDGCILCSRDECMCASAGLKSEGKRSSIPSLDMILNSADIKMEAVPLKRPSATHAGPKPKFMRIEAGIGVPSPMEGLPSLADGCGFCTEDTPCACAAAESPRTASPTPNAPTHDSHESSQANAPNRHSLNGSSHNASHSSGYSAPPPQHNAPPHRGVSAHHNSSGSSHSAHNSPHAPPYPSNVHPPSAPAPMFNAPYNAPFSAFGAPLHAHSPGPPSPLPPGMIPAPLMYPVPGYLSGPAPPLLHAPPPANAAANATPAASPQMSPGEEEDYGCANCQKDAMSMLFCVSLPSAAPLAPGAVAIPCHLAVKTLQKHPKFATCDLGRLIRKLEVRGKQVGVQSINRALQDLEHP